MFPAMWMDKEGVKNGYILYMYIFRCRKKECSII